MQVLSRSEHKWRLCDHSSMTNLKTMQHFTHLLMDTAAELAQTAFSLNLQAASADACLPIGPLEY